MITKKYIQDVKDDFRIVSPHKQIDANESIFFALELQHIESQVVEVEYQDLMARQIIPISMEADPADETIAYYQFDKVGNAKIVIDYANDFPRVDLLGQKFTSTIRSLGDAFGYSVQEIRAARKVNRPLTTMLAEVAKRAAMELEDELAWFGDSTHGIPGFFTNPNIPVLSLPNDGTGNSVAWADKTPDQILRDLNLIVNTIVSNTLAVEKMKKLVLLPYDSYNYIESTPRSSTTDTTILSFFLKNNAYVEGVQPLNETSALGPGGTRGIMAFTKSNLKVKMHIPQDFEMFPVQEKGLSFEVPCHSRFGGVIWYKPGSAMIAYGI